MDRVAFATTARLSIARVPLGRHHGGRDRLHSLDLSMERLHCIDAGTAAGG